MFQNAIIMEKEIRNKASLNNRKTNVLYSTEKIFNFAV